MNVTGEGVEWIVEDALPQRPTNPRRGLLAKLLVVFVLAVVAGFGVFTLNSYERVQAPVPLASPTPTPSLDLDSFGDPQVKGRLETVLATLPDLTLVLPQSGGRSTLRVASGSQVEVNAEVFDQLHSLSIDYSGQWIAGMSGRPDGDGATLMIGRVDEPLQVAAEGVLGFAWHLSEPGTVGFSSGGTLGTETQILAGDVRLETFDPQPTIAADGHLEMWGDWGFVTRPTLNDSHFHVLDPDGNDVATGYEGSVVGTVNQRLVVNLEGGRQSPVFIFADTGQAWPIFALTDTDFVRSVVSSTRGNAVAMQVSSTDNDTHEIRIFPGDGRPFHVVSTSESTGALSWSADASTLYFLSRSPAASSTDLFEYHVPTRQLTITPVGDSEWIDHWASAIAVDRDQLS